MARSLAGRVMLVAAFAATAACSNAGADAEEPFSACASPRPGAVDDRVAGHRTEDPRRVEERAAELHRRGEAIDLRANDVTEEQAHRIVKSLQQRLGPDYDVVQGPNHIHVGYDPRPPLNR